VARGNEVFVVGPGQRRGRGTFFSTGDLPDPGRLGDPIPEVAHAAGAANVLAELEVDVVHDHSLAGPLLAYHRPVPTVVTAHGPVGGDPQRHPGRGVPIRRPQGELRGFHGAPICVAGQPGPERRAPTLAFFPQQAPNLT
jgi:hypothetical protein